MISMPVFVCLLMIVYLPNSHTLIVQDNDKRKKKTEGGLIYAFQPRKGPIVLQRVL